MSGTLLTTIRGNTPMTLLVTTEFLRDLSGIYLKLFEAVSYRIDSQLIRIFTAHFLAYLDTRLNRSEKGESDKKKFKNMFLNNRVG